MARSGRRRRTWLIPTTIALITFLGGLSGNLLTSDSAAQSFLANYRGWIWTVTALAGLAALLAAYWDSRQEEENTTAQRILSHVDSYGEMERHYLTRIAERYQYLPLRGVDFKSASAETGAQERLSMADVYIALHVVRKGERVDGDESDKEAHTSFLRQQEEKPTPLLTTVANLRRTVITGDPGSGKTTFINHLTFCLARERLNPKEDWLARLPEWPVQEATLLPVPVALREVAAWFQAIQPHQRKTGLLQEYLAFWLDEIGLGEFYELLCSHLSKGTALLLLDGLDEVPLQEDVLSRIKEMIGDLPAAYPHCRIFVTCRVLSYRDPRWQLAADAWPVVELAPLNEEQIDRFIRAWYEQLATMRVVSHGVTQSGRLSQAVRRPDLWRLAANPLLLTVMALVHTHKGELPDARAALYEDVVDLLLWRWEAIKLENRDGRETSWRQLLQEAELNDVDLKRVLWELAFEAHSQQRRLDDGDSSKPTADIGQAALLRALRQLHPEQSLDWADRLIQIMKLRAGLLVEGIPEVYSFPHRTFQEFLAGCYLGNLADFTEQALVLAAEGAYWREAILLAVGRLVHVSGDIDRPLMLVNELCLPSLAGVKEDAEWRKVWLAGECLLELGLKRAERRRMGADLVRRVQTQLQALIEQSQLTPRERAEAGSILSGLGDPRDLTEMVPVAAGEFEMGGERYSDEKPRHKVTVGDFRMSKYPVTNGQYARFVAAAGHRPPPHWRGDRPPAELLAHPVVGVSWHDAMAYCAWWSRERGELVRLPSEAEWEKAARGTDRREYPWGDNFDARLCNMSETGIGGTSPVGIFPQGASPYGCLDMAGNVWEWTSSLWGKKVGEPDFGYPYDATDGREEHRASDDVLRVVRGGSWLYDEDDVRCAYRSGFNPTFRYLTIGFRVVAPGL